ncbi:MAG: MFS transporter [Actinomycetota bacterium]|nr:MFS transporter [Actinomycetota bacterium]
MDAVLTAGRLARIRGAFRSGPLASPAFRLYCAGQLSSTAGDYCYAVALPWLVLSNHGSPTLLGTILVFYGLARVLLIPVGGVFADKVGPRRVMIGADIMRCAMVGVLVVLAAKHITPLAALGPMAAAIGAGEGLFLPASYAMIPTIAEPEQLGIANSLSGGIIQIGSVLGPVLGASLVAAAGPAPALAVDAATFAVSALTLMLIRSSAPSVAADAGSADAGSVVEVASASTDQEAVGSSTTIGVRDLLRSRAFQLLLLIIVVSNAAWGGTLEVALPSLAHQHFGVTGYGVLLTAITGGIVIGTFGAAVVKPRQPMLLALLVFLADGASCAALPYLGGLAGAVAAALVFGLCNGLATVLVLTVIQRWAPARLLGTTMSVIFVAAMAVFPLSSGITGILVRHVGPSIFFPIAGLTLACSLVIGFASKQLRELGSDMG